MSNIMFFSIPAYGHTNPTIGVVAELVKRNHRVRYYSFEEFRKRIEDTGAEYVSCDKYLPPEPKNLGDKVGKDFASLIEMVVDTTISMNPVMEKEISGFKPDCIISDSVCFWGKLFALKYGIPFVCSTTTMAFNRYTAKLMKQDFFEMFRMVTGMPRINRKMKELKNYGYHVKNLVSVLQNDNDTNTIVYTSKMFQPMAETFSEKYAFVGPSVSKTAYSPNRKRKIGVYISLGTVLNNDTEFYRACIKALEHEDFDVVISVGTQTDIKNIGNIPQSFTILPYVDQLDVLSKTDVFLTHCGMNSVNESLYMGVPMILYPQHSEENAVATRIEQLGAGIRLKGKSPEDIRKAVFDILDNREYKKNAMILRDDFGRCGGAVQAADFIEDVISREID